MNGTRRWLLPAALGWSTLVLGIVEWSVGSGLAFRPFIELADPRVGPAGFGALVTHAILCESDKRKTIVLRFGVLLEVVRFVLLAMYGVSLEVLAFSVGYGFLAAAIADFVFHGEWRSMALAALVPIGMASAPLGLAGIVRRATPLTLDGALYALDASLRIPFSKLLGEFVQGVAALRAMSLIVSAALPGAIADGLAYEEYTYRKGIERGVGVNLLLAYTVSGSVAAMLYILCPGTGPSHAFMAGFPSHLPNPTDVPLTFAALAPNSPRNAMPSLHFAWAVLLYRSTAGARGSIRKTALAFVVMTFIATIGSGEHFVFDLIADAPFIVALEAATAHRTIPFRRRIGPIVAGLILYGGWMIAIRNAPVSIPFLTAHPALVWLLVVVTIAIPSWLALGAVAPQWRTEVEPAAIPTDAAGA